jgi:dihydroorotase
MPAEVLRNVRVLDPLHDGDRQADVLIESNRIGAIAPNLPDIPSDAIVQDCDGMILGPGLVDLYSQSGEPGHESRETLQSLMLAGSAGGFTALSLLPGTDPVVDTPAGVSWVRAHTPLTTPHLGIWGALTLGIEGQTMGELADLAAASVIGFTDGQPLQNRGLLRRILEYAQPLQRPIALWCCDRTLQGDGVMREGIDSIRFGLPGVPAIAETTALAMVLECVAAIETPIHLMRISTARSVALIAQAKAQGLPITASTTWMHLLLTTSALQGYDPNLRLDPPLGTSADQLALLQAVESGVIDAIAIDHTPHTYEEKTVAFAEAPPGVIGLELALPLLWDALVTSGKWSALTLWRALSTRPTQCLQRSPVALVAGELADMTLFDPHKTWQVTPQTLHSHSHNTPWLGKNIRGQVCRTWSPTN